MYTLFDKPKTASQPTLGAANWGYVRDGLQRNLRKVLMFYRRAPMAVKSDHFLIRLLQSVGVSFNLPTERFYANLNGLDALNLSMALRMTSEVFRGSAFRGVFYGPDSREILIAHTADFDPFEADEHWEDLEPIRVLRHPHSDLGLWLPDGKAAGSEYGLAVIAINLPMLAMQYRAWRRRENYVAEQTGDSPLGISHFVHMYALPNMLYSHLDYVLFNRAQNTISGKPMGVANRRHSFAMLDLTDKLNKVQTTQLQQLKNVTRDWAGILHNLPAVTLPTQAEVMQVPSLAPTQQVSWALALARLPAVDFLTRFTENQGEKNGQELNRVRQAIRAYRGNAIFRRMLPEDLAMDTEWELDQIAERVG